MIKKLDIKNMVSGVIANKVGCNKSDVKFGVGLSLNQLGADSIEEVEIIMSLEEILKINIGEDITNENLKTVDGIIKYIEGVV